ncbi:MAG TPA: hypothetical protein PL009_04640 [Flavipsychrobacter sp.]|nr:hypothetical protein [Flavipsychrobacter sp.]
MPNNRLNKTVAGYHLLMILSAVDFRVGFDEDKVIRDYLVTEFPFRVNLDREMAIISNLKPDEWEAHFLKMMDDFYDDATEEERNKLLRFALKITKADNVITAEENRFLNHLFENWKPEEA